MLSPNTKFNLSDQYGRAVAGLNAMGFSEQHSIPAFEQVQRGLTSNPMTPLWLDQRKALGAQDELAMTPSVQIVGIMGSKREPGLVPRFNRMPGPEKKVRVSKYVWNNFRDDAPVHDNHRAESWLVDVVLGDITDPRDPHAKPNSYDEPGLVYTGLKVDQQREALELEAAQEAAKGREVGSVPVGHIITLNAGRRVAGQTPLDRHTETRLVHYPDTLIVSIYHLPVRLQAVPTTFHEPNRLNLFQNFLNSSKDNIGVRRALRVPIETEG